jgi:DNA polymerase I
MKVAMINIDNWIKQNNFAIKMIMQVHDELVFEVAANDVAAVTPHIKNLMENAIKIDVPVVVHIGVGDNWDEAH